MSTKQKTTERGWTTVSNAAAFFGMTPQAIRQTYFPCMRDSDIRKSANPVVFRVAALIEVMVEKRVAERVIVTSQAPPDELLLEEGDSPALERYRLAKAKLAELDLETRKGQLIERDKARDIFSRWAVLIRRMGERLAKRFGPDAAATVNETLDSCRAAVVEVVES